mgnify:CR=1 FL=1
MGAGVGRLVGGVLGLGSAVVGRLLGWGGKAGGSSAAAEQQQPQHDGSSSSGEAVTGLLFDAAGSLLVLTEAGMALWRLTDKHPTVGLEDDGFGALKRRLLYSDRCCGVSRRVSLPGMSLPGWVLSRRRLLSSVSLLPGSIPPGGFFVFCFHRSLSAPR